MLIPCLLENFSDIPKNTSILLIQHHYLRRKEAKKNADFFTYCVHYIQKIGDFSFGFFLINTLK